MQGGSPGPVGVRLVVPLKFLDMEPVRAWTAVF